MTEQSKGALRAAIGLVVRGYLDEDQIEDIATAVVRLGYRPPTEYVYEWGVEAIGVVEFRHESDARDQHSLRPETKLVRREVGPWIEAT